MKAITVEELKSKIDNKEDCQLIDVREEFEYETSHINGEHIPFAEVVPEHDKPWRDNRVTVQRRSGKRSAQAIMMLEREGFDKLYNLEGGILAWRDTFDPDMEVY